ncbi:transposase [Enterobacter hormaechei]|nr:transposase [Enterobacter hormaechei]
MIRTAGSLKLGKVQVSVLVRSLLKSERPSGLTQAIIEVGRINKTLYLLNYIDDEDYRRRILTQLNRGESRHAVARAICHGQKGEIRKRYTDGQEDQLGTLGLVTNAVVGTVAKLAMRQPFVLFKGLTFQKLCLPGAFRPGDHHNKMLRPGLCVVHASPQYL